jgi:hypothetical protein
MHEPTNHFTGELVLMKTCNLSFDSHNKLKQISVNTIPKRKK